jgi:hypothetical protein
MNVRVASILNGFLTVTLLVACGNPVNRESNPLKNYNDLRNDLPEQNIPKNRPQDEGPKQFCQKPYVMDITTPDSTGKETEANFSMSFLVDQEKIYHISLQSLDSLKLSLNEAPTGMKLTDQGSGKWELRWKPPMKEANIGQYMQIVADLPQSSCVQGTVGEPVFVTVNVNSLKPVVNVIGFEDSKKFSLNDKFSFSVDIFDPTLASGATPATPLLLFPGTNGFPETNPTTEIRYLRSDTAVSCAAPQATRDPQVFRSTCSFDASQIVSANADAYGPDHLSLVVFSALSSKGEQAIGVPKTFAIDLPPAPAVVEAPKKAASDNTSSKKKQTKISNDQHRKTGAST